MPSKTKQKLRDTRLLLLLVAGVAAYFSGALPAAALLAVIICWYFVKSPMASPAYIRRQTAALSGLAAILLLILVATARLSLHEFITDCGLLALAILPLQQLLAQRQLPASSVGTKLTLVGIGIAAQALFAVPAPVSLLELVLFDLLCAVIQRLPRHAMHERHPVGLSILAGGLSYSAFPLFFARRGLSPVNIDPASHLYFAATTLGLAVLALCVLGPSLFKMNRRHLVAGSTALVAMLTLFSYLPWLQNVLQTGQLQAGDWLLAAGATAVFYLAHGLHRHSRRHTHHALLRDHPLEALRKHPKLA